MAKLFIAKILASMVLSLLSILSKAEDSFNDLDEKLIISLATPNKANNGHQLFEGDIIQDTNKYVDKPVKALPSKGALWTERVIPYEFHHTVNRSSQEIIREAMDNWEKVTCITFVPRTNQKHFLRFRTDSPGCFTFVGRKQHMEGQDVNLGPGCMHLQIAMHEIGHSLGFFHEHSRKDRSSVIKILWHNIQKGMASQFRPGNDDPRGVPYDVTSVMHYSPMSFSSKIFEKNTMVSLDPRLQTLIGRSMGITFRDAKIANMMYSCDEDCPNKDRVHCLNEGYLSPHKPGSKACSCVCPPNTKGKKCEIRSGDYYGDLICGGDISKEGEIKTPRYPSRSPNESCSWILTAPYGKRVRVTFDDFSFRPRMDKPGSPYNGLCVYESVEIRTTNLDEGDFYCGDDITPGSALESTSNKFLILIRADRKAEGRGLKAYVQFI